MFKKISFILSSILILFICVGVMPIHKVDAEDTHSHNGVTFNKTFSKAIEEATEEYDCYKLKSGNYYLDEDYSLSKNIVIDSDTTVNICLNGYVLNLQVYKLEVISGGTLNIYSCNSTNNHYFTITEDSLDDFKDGLWRIADTQTDNVIKGSVITNTQSGDYSIKNSGTLLADSVNFVGIYANQEPINSGGKFNIYNSNFIGNRGQLGYGMVNGGDELNIYNSKFKYNKSNNYGGAVYLSSKALIKDSILEDNEAEYGGAILCSDAKLTLINTKITNNTASVNGGGIYLSKKTMCLKEGTKILMADGSLSNIEDVKENDYIKSFDHFSGELVNEKVFLAYQGKDKTNTFTLHFDDGDEVGIAGRHDLFSKKTMNYVTINELNVSDYIGDYFYDAVNKRWDKLVNVRAETELSNYYSLYTEHSFNCIANNMLTVPDDGDDFLKIFKFNNDLTVNQEELNKDIKKYGLYEFEDDGYITKEEYDAYNVKYLNIVIGKGIATLEEIKGYYKENKELKEDYKTLSITNLFTSLFKTNKVSADDEITCDTYITDGMSTAALILGSNVTIKDNKANSVDDNLYLNHDSEAVGDGNPYVYFIDGTKGLDIGIKHSLGSAAFTKDNTVNYYKYFKSDSDIFKVTYNSKNVLKLDRVYNFTALTSNTTSINLDGVTESKAKDIGLFYLAESERFNNDVIVYGKDGDNYSTITYDGSAWQSSESMSLDTLKSKTAYVIGLIKEADKKLISEDEEDCTVNSDGKGYAEYTVGKGKDTIMHIDGFSSTSDYNSLTITCGDRYLKDDEYEVSNGSIKVKLLESFVNSLNVGTNLVKVEVTKGTAKYLFELNIKINSVNSSSNIDYKVVKTHTY